MKKIISLILSALLMSPQLFANEEYLKSSLVKMSKHAEAPEYKNILLSTAYECQPTVKNINLAAPSIKITLIRNNEYVWTMGLDEEQKAQQLAFEVTRENSMQKEAVKRLNENGEILPKIPQNLEKLTPLELQNLKLEIFYALQNLATKIMKEREVQPAYKSSSFGTPKPQPTGDTEDQVFVEGTVVHNFNDQPTTISGFLSGITGSYDFDKFPERLKYTLEFLQARVADVALHLLPMEDKKMYFFSSRGPFNKNAYVGPEVNKDQLEKGLSISNYIVTPNFDKGHPEEFNIQMFFGLHNSFKWAMNDLAEYADIPTPEFHEYACTQTAQKETKEDSEAVLNQWIAGALPLEGEGDTQVKSEPINDEISAHQVQHFMNSWLLLAYLEKSRLLNKVSEQIKSMENQEKLTLAAIALTGTWASVKMTLKRIPILGTAVVATFSAQAVYQSCHGPELISSLEALPAEQLSLCLNKTPRLKKEFRLLMEEMQKSQNQ